MIQRLIIVLLFSFTQNVIADEASDVAEFNAAYSDYLDLVNTAEDLDVAIVTAEKVYQLAPSIYKKKSFEYAVITYNLANLHDEKGGASKNENEEKALKLYRNYFKIIDKLKIPRDLDYIDKYFIYITTYHNIYKAKASTRYEKKLLKIVKSLNLTDHIKADLNYKLAELKIKAWNINKSAKYYQKAHKLYLSAYGPDYLKIANTLFMLGNIATLNNKLNTANKNFLETLRIWEVNIGDKADLPVSLHAFMVNLYEAVGKFEKATKHVIATAVPYNEDAKNIRVLYKAPLVMPDETPDEIENYEVVLNFTIDKTGRAKNIIITETDNIVFNENSIASLKKFRFTPTIKNDELAEINNVAFTMSFYNYLGSQSYLVRQYGDFKPTLPNGFNGKLGRYQMIDPNLQ